MQTAEKRCVWTRITPQTAARKIRESMCGTTSIAALVVEDKNAARQRILAYKAELNAHQSEAEKERLRNSKQRLEKLQKLIPSIYEDKVLGKIPKDVCVSLLEKYQTEQKELFAAVEKLEAKLFAVKQDEDDVEESTPMCRNLPARCAWILSNITVDEDAADRPRDIHIYYKLLDKPLKDKRRLDTAIIK